MIALRLGTTIKDAEPQEVFDTLSNPDALQSLLPRMRKVEYTPLQGSQAKLVMHVSIGQTFGTIRCDGILSWDEPNRLMFKVNTPLPVTMNWNLDPSPTGGTDMDVTLRLDLFPLLGPMAAFVPQDVVKAMMETEIRHAMKVVAKQVEAQRNTRRMAA